MLTRLEVDGFKNILGLAVDFGPYTCIAGPNAVGKSNIFDAVQFLSMLADMTFVEAATRIRSDTSSAVEPSSLFFTDGSGTTTTMRLAVEMLLPSEVEDDFGRNATPTSTFVRYELALGYETPESLGPTHRMGRIVLRSESLRHITSGDAPARLAWKHSKAKFRDAVVFNNRQGVAFISTTMDADEVVVNVHQDGGSRGKPRKSPATRAPRTVVSTTTTSDDPTILAARREMQQWRTLALEPSAMRSPDSASGPSQIDASGAHLAAALFRLEADYGSDVLAEIASASSALTDVRDVSVDYDGTRDTLTLQARIGNGPALPARALSDGTLRFIALCIIDRDPTFGGVVCMEEPENGIHPARIRAMVELVRGLAVDPSLAPGSQNPLRQVLVNTHSPAFVKYQDAEDVLLAMPARTRRNGSLVSTVRLMPLAGTWRSRAGGGAISKATISDYLSEPEDAQLSLDIAIAT